jgi:hypothetical protein
MRAFTKEVIEIGEKTQRWEGEKLQQLAEKYKKAVRTAWERVF